MGASLSVYDLMTFRRLLALPVALVAGLVLAGPAQK